MCRMTDTGFRWQRKIRIGEFPRRWYAYEREPGVLRYSAQREEGFAPLYAIMVTPRMPGWYRDGIQQ